MDGSVKQLLCLVRMWKISFQTPRVPKTLCCYYILKMKAFSVNITLGSCVLYYIFKALSQNIVAT